MKLFLHVSLLLTISFIAEFSQAQPVYCNPPVTTGGIYLSFAGFGPPYGTIPGGANYNSGGTFASEGYVNRSASSSGTVNRGCSNNYFYSIQNCGNQGNKNFNFRIYADWNQDGDFNDANELAAEVNNTVLNGNCGFYNTTVTIIVPQNANAGIIRLRWALSEAGTAAACGGYKGEIEDYSVTVAANTAPVLNNSGTPLLQPLIETQTNNDGLLVRRFIQTPEPAVTLITESDPCASQKGIAITGTNGANGSWQYQLGAGSWINMGAVSGANALLLNETEHFRFVPTGPGTSGITFRAWDKTVSASGQYYNISSTGGNTAFSSASETANLETYSTASSSGDITVYMPTTNSVTSYNIVTSSLSPSTGIFKHTNSLTTDNSSGYGVDITLDAVNNKIYWLGGPGNYDVMRSNTDGTNVETILTAASFSYPTGIAIGGNKIFIADYYTALYSANLDGSGFTAITGNAGQASDIGELSDIEYFNGKIYYFNNPQSGSGTAIFAANADGTGTVQLAATSSWVTGLDVVNNNIYWTETDFSTTSYLRTMAITGGSVTTLATAAGRNFLDLMVSPSNSKIYFTDMTFSSLDPYVKSIPITGGTTTKELVLENNIYSLVFNRNFTTLPVKFISIKAWPQGPYNVVEWNISDEENVDRYVIERSTDGRLFTDAGTVAASQSSRYQWTDVQPVNANNYYRVYSADHDGKKLYTSTVVVNREGENKSITVLPTVVSNGQFTLRLQNIARGSYQLNVVNSSGQNVYSQNILHSGGSSVQNINLPAQLSKGIYRVVIRGNTESYTTVILLN